jgi:hypothetical protein
MNSNDIKIPAGTKRIEIRCYGEDGLEIGDSQGMEAEGYNGALSQPAAVEGWVMVPVEPTHAMVKAMSESKARDDEGEFPAMLDLLDFSGENKTHTVLKAAYRDMLSAAPTPPSAPVQQSVREAFESHQLGRYQYADITRHTDGRYLNAFMESEWETWQAALSASPAGDKVEGGVRGLVAAAESVCKSLEHPTESVNALQVWNLRDALTAISTSPLLDKNDQAEGEDFEAWWKREGQFVRAGGGDYEKCFAYAAWNYAHPKPPQPDSNELADMLRRLEVSANTVDYCYARNPGNFASAMAGLVDSATAARELLAQSPSVELNTKKGW